MAFVEDPDEQPIVAARRYVGYLIQTIQNHPQNSSLERILKDLQRLSKIIEKEPFQRQIGQVPDKTNL